MEIIRGQHNLRAGHRGSVATIGNFDGVHNGHRAIVRDLQARARAAGQPATVITFEPQPQEYFAPADSPARLTRLREKLEQLQALEVDRVMLMRFGVGLAQLTAEEFVQQLLVDGLQVSHVTVGDDFRFGAGRQGDFRLLTGLGEQSGFGVSAVPTFSMEGERVSSTRIRRALVDHDLAMAEKLLGRPFSLSGRVAYGNQKGRTIGYPTANIHLHRSRSPVAGVYAVRLHGLDHGSQVGVANIGIRPTVEGEPKVLLEVHVFDFAHMIYGQHVEVEFCHWIRAEQKFESFDALKAQIHKDAQTARDYFANLPA